MIADRRAQFTDSVIRDEFKKLLLEMPFEKITVSEICRRCDINRGTFYLHYTDCFALYESLGAELADRLFSVIRNHNPINNVPAMMESCMNLSPLDQILFHDRQSKCFDRLLTMAKEQTVNAWSLRSGLKQAELECIFTFIANGCHAVASSAVFDETAQNDHIYQLMQKLITNGLYSLVNPEY